MQTHDECPVCGFKYMRRYGSRLYCPRCHFEMSRSWNKGKFRYKIEDVGKDRRDRR